MLRLATVLMVSHYDCKIEPQPSFFRSNALASHGPNTTRKKQIWSTKYATNMSTAHAVAIEVPEASAERATDRLTHVNTGKIFQIEESVSIPCFMYAASR